jgi:hypothetical protein
VIKINRDRIVRAALGSARLEGYKGSPKDVTSKKAASKTGSKSKTAVKQ